MILLEKIVKYCIKNDKHNIFEKKILLYLEINDINQLTDD